MDSVELMRERIKKVLTDLTVIPVSHGKIELQTVFDEAQDHYLMLGVGWDGAKRIYAPIAHIDIINGKYWIQQDGTEESVTSNLEDLGATPEQIVLAFHYIKTRPYTGYAIE